MFFFTKRKQSVTKFWFWYKDEISPKLSTLGPFIPSAVRDNLVCGASVSDDKTMKNLLTQDLPDHGLWARDKSFFFFKISQLCWPIEQMGPINCGVFSVELFSTHFVIVCSQFMIFD